MKPNYVYLDYPYDLEVTSKKILKHLLTTKIFSEPANWMGPVPLDGLWADVPELKEWLDGMGLVVEKIAVLGYIDTATIHIDYNATPRINFPVLNGSTAITSFYQLDNLVQTRQMDDRVEYWHLEYTNTTEIDSYQLSKPVVFDPNIPHGVFFETAMTARNPRLALSIVFLNPPWNLLIP
jgi:hypothetical protein